MPQRGPAVLTLALLIGVLGGACRTQPTPAEVPDEQRPQIEAGEQVDAPVVCTAACERLEQCVPELASDIDGDPSVIAERLARECDGACEGFADQHSALAVRDCTTLNSCTAFWGCVGTASARPWLAAVAPVGERTCENLCSQASACAIAQVCEIETGGRKGRPGKTGKADADLGSEGESAKLGNSTKGQRGSSAANPPKDSVDAENLVDAECVRDDALRGELDEHCLMQCRALPEASRARTELIGCIDHVSCDGLLGCLDGWTGTTYDDASGSSAGSTPSPGISPTCDGFCSRAIVCGAAEEEVELEPEELDALKQTMTSTYVECAVQCEKDLEVGGAAVSEAFDACTAAETCELFQACADEA